jgi:dipeptidyl aminopeptidase/acylaminoacyl peptidase
LHGQKDEWVPVEQAYNIYQRLREPKTLDIIPGADHRFSDNHRRQQAIERTVTFFRKYLQ